MCRPTFQHLHYGPMQVRGLWRARRLPGERLVGWGVVWPPPTASQAALEVALSMVPGVGQIAAMLLDGPGRGRRWLMILSDRRVILLRPSASGPSPNGRGVFLDEPVELVEVLCDLPRGRSRQARGAPPKGRSPVGTSSLTFELHVLSARSIKLELRPTTPAGVRLAEGLLLLSGNASGDDRAGEGSEGRSIQPA